MRLLVGKIEDLGRAMSKRIDDLGVSITERFDGVDGRLDTANGRLGKHDDAIARIEVRGCARYADHLEPPPTPSRLKRAGETTGIAAAVVAFLELLKAWAR